MAATLFISSQFARVVKRVDLRSTARSREGVLQHFCVVLDTHKGCMSDRGRAGCLKGALCSFVWTLGGRAPGCSW